MGERLEVDELEDVLEGDDDGEELCWRRCLHLLYAGVTGHFIPPVTLS